MIDIVTVHTTGVNWDGILTNVASISVIMFGLGAIGVRSIRRSIKDEVRDVIQTDVTPLLKQIEIELRDHDTRIARLEGVEEGKRQAVAQAGVSTTRSISSRKADP